jgi:hypothetical protein
MLKRCSNEEHAAVMSDRRAGDIGVLRLRDLGKYLAKQKALGKILARSLRSG